jgi:hypothetical protein
MDKGSSRWVPRQEVRDLARQSVGDTGLLDYVLKGLGGKKMGGYVFRREVNQVGFAACLAEQAAGLLP